MHFVDECTLTVEAGAGGDGAIAFRREKFVPFGGPAGGDGGRGGSVVFVGDEGLGTLHDLTHRRLVKADSGVNGGNKDMHGRAGRDAILRVPLGTIAVDTDTAEVLFEITAHGQRCVAAAGGHGGRGNKHFATPVDRAPRRAEPGTPGQQRRLRLELKVMADVGLLGYPNVGKSTLIRAISRAHPKVADYPFTTLEPHLGVVKVDGGGLGQRQSFVVADIPGLVEGASDGAGLGHQFLRHVQRSRVLVHLVTLTAEPERNPLEDYETIRRELGRFDTTLLERPEIVLLSKADLTEVREAYPTLKADFEARGVEIMPLSSATRQGIGELIQAIVRELTRVSAASEPDRAESE